MSCSMRYLFAFSVPLLVISTTSSVESGESDSMIFNASWTVPPLEIFLATAATSACICLRDLSAIASSSSAVYFMPLILRSFSYLSLPMAKLSVESASIPSIQRECSSSADLTSAALLRRLSITSDDTLSRVCFSTMSRNSGNPLHPSTAGSVHTRGVLMPLNLSLNCWRYLGISPSLCAIESMRFSKGA